MDPATVVVVTIVLGVAGVALGILGLAATIYYGRKGRHQPRCEHGPTELDAVIQPTKFTGAGK